LGGLRCPKNNGDTSTLYQPLSNAPRITLSPLSQAKPPLSRAKLAVMLTVSTMVLIGFVFVGSDERGTGKFIAAF